MASNLNRCDSVEEDYIDMEVSSLSSLITATAQNNSNQREFEFQMSLCSLERDSTTSPADELFYKGKLLPLHLPPRLQMVEKLLETAKDFSFDEFYGTPLATCTVPSPTTSNTPFESCNVSPVESCQVSRELNPSEYFSEVFSDFSESAVDNTTKKSWSRKLKLIKQSSLGSKLKASKAYLRALFGKSGCSDESCTYAARVADEGSASKADYRQRLNNKYAKMESSRIPFGQIQKENRKTQNSVSGSHRRSFSVSMRRQLPLKSSFKTTPSSNDSSGFHPLQFLKRSTSINSDVENSIQGAILHCKQSLQQKSDVGFCSMSATRVVAATDDQERAQIFRG
ncbi:PREDICTED: probable membrane-associated kinase regulator 4 [Tarenaya hassleriana]|uniref:probable membrane-associated kinase regulator 4 n=1 Tax=Tarenaya hassleriana TaxID=28532 RepID=UPI00053C9DC5|nr:PREDICTED: probable membrane-associated kinase regulator 4 [Tarenaya hassleriana]